MASDNKPPEKPDGKKNGEPDQNEVQQVTEKLVSNYLHSLNRNSFT